jgi:quinol-cytochrome oxidoreductase complex cytochrome b subunit
VIALSVHAWGLGVLGLVVTIKLLLSYLDAVHTQRSWWKPIVTFAAASVIVSAIIATLVGLAWLIGAALTWAGVVA